ncbi:MAG: YihY family inner membrane protein [Burkholderiales bacterium]
MNAYSSRASTARTTSAARLRALRGRVALAWASFQHWPWLETLRTLRQRFREDHLGLTASSLTFTTTIALVPLATVMFAVFTAFPMFGSFRKALETYFIQNLVPDGIAKPVLGALTQFALKANRLGTVGLIALVLTALALMLTIDRTLNAIWRVRQPRSMAQRVLVYWAAATLGPLVLGVSLSLTSYAVSASRGLVGTMPGEVSLILNLLQLVLLSVGVAALFRYVPNTYVRWSHAWAGGIFVALGFEAAKRTLAWYLGAVPVYSTIYGAFATVPIFLVWLYVGWVIVLLGAVIAAYAPSLEMRVVRHAETPGYRFALALALLRELLSARDSAARGLGLGELGTRLRIDPLQAEPILETLAACDWIGRLDEEGAQRFVLLAEPATTPLAPLLSDFLLEPGPAVAGFWQGARLDELRLADALQRPAA